MGNRNSEGIFHQNDSMAKEYCSLIGEHTDINEYFNEKENLRLLVILPRLITGV